MSPASATLERSGAGGLVVLAPLSIEARAARAGASGARVHRVGMGPRRAARWAQLADEGVGGTLLIAGFCGALDPELEPGHVVLATELHGPNRTIACADPGSLAGALRHGGLQVRTGPIASTRLPVLGRRRRALRGSGALAVDMESAWLAPAARGRPPAVLRVVVDTERHELYRPLRTVAGAAIAYRALRRACGLAEEWARDAAREAG